MDLDSHEIEPTTGLSIPAITTATEPSQPSSSKRKYQELQDVHTPLSPTNISLPPSHVHTVLSPTNDTISSIRIHDTAPGVAQKVYITRTAPHVLEEQGGNDPINSNNNSSVGDLSRPQSPSAPPSGRSSPASDDDLSAADGHGSLSHHIQSHHIVPKGFRGPQLRKGDAEELAPRPQLISTVGSATLFNTTNFAVNRNGWRYTGAGPASHHLPQTVLKTIEIWPPCIHWCWSDRSAFIKINADASVISTDKGFRSTRTNIGVRQGEWYVEVQVLPPEHLVAGVGAPGPIPTYMKDGSHIRVGWGRREAGLNAPVGSDGYSYAYRDQTGDKVFLSRPQPYGRPFKAGDVVGLYIKLPSERAPNDEWDPANIKRERIPIRYKGRLYFESLEYLKSREMEQLVDRSRKGKSTDDAMVGIEGTGIWDPNNGDSVYSNGVVGAGAGVGLAGASTAVGPISDRTVGTSGSGSAKVKNRKAPGAKDKPAGPAKPSLRPIPRLPGSKIGFFVNGEPQGTAFNDLFDYRPLRVKGFANTDKLVQGKVGGSRGGGKSAVKSGELPITIRNRENIFDDGALGYFPFVSAYGGARAKLITGEDGFRFPPPDNIEAALEEVDQRRAGILAEEAKPKKTDQNPEHATGSASNPDCDMNLNPNPQKQGEQNEDKPKSRLWKPLYQRYAEHIEEQWQYDLADEQCAQATVDKEEEEKAKRSKAAKERAAARKRDKQANQEFDQVKIEQTDPATTATDVAMKPVVGPDAEVNDNARDIDMDKVVDEVAHGEQPFFKQEDPTAPPTSTALPIDSTNFLTPSNDPLTHKDLTDISQAEPPVQHSFNRLALTKAYIPPLSSSDDDNDIATQNLETKQESILNPMGPISPLLSASTHSALPSTSNHVYTQLQQQDKVETENIDVEMETATDQKQP